MSVGKNALKKLHMRQKSENLHTLQIASNDGMLIL